MSRQLDLAVCSHDELYNRLQVFGGLLLLDCSTETLEGPLIHPAERVPPPAAPPPTSKARIDHVLLLSEVEARASAAMAARYRMARVSFGMHSSRRVTVSLKKRFETKRKTAAPAPCAPASAVATPAVQRALQWKHARRCDAQRVEVRNLF